MPCPLAPLQSELARLLLGSLVGVTRTSVKGLIVERIARYSRAHWRRAIISAAQELVRVVKPQLADCGYRWDLLQEDVPFSGSDGKERHVPLVAFADAPPDARSACISCISSDASDTALVTEIAALRDLGTPVTLVWRSPHFEWWMQHSDVPTLVKRYPISQAATLFNENRTVLDPKSIYRAKTRGRFEQAHQLEFVDAGLMPIIENEIGTKVARLVERVVAELKQQLDPNDDGNKQGEWILRAAFWLLAAKILRDKGVRNFRSLDIRSVDEVFTRVGKHYNTENPLQIRGARRRAALEAAASEVERFSHLGQVTTESLAYVYENALVSKAARKNLGTHSTPPFLVDYIIGRIAPRIEALQSEERVVFEPACGHAAFLVAAMRLLRDLLPTSVPAQTYLRQRLWGIEFDTAAHEIARLSLTLADVPNPNGWQLKCGDMFDGDELKRRAEKATILLANPPFEDFKQKELEKYSARNIPAHQNKSAELLARTLPYLPKNSVFGLVLPQSILHAKGARDVRRVLLKDFELEEISLFPDKVFRFSDVESVVLLGHKPSRAHQGTSVRYRRIREHDIAKFQRSYTATTERDIRSKRFLNSTDYTLFVPDLEQVWEALQDRPRLSSIARVGQGFSHVGEEKRKGIWIWSEEEPKKARGSEKEEPKAVQGFYNFEQSEKAIQLHEGPKKVWINLDPDIVERFRWGKPTKKPQLLMNYHPVSRGPWRLKAFIDRGGHAFASSYSCVRPQDQSTPLEFLWALCNSPVANAYAYAHLAKRNILAGVMNAMPIPHLSVNGIARTVRAAKEYLDAVKPLSAGSPVNADLVRARLLDVDAEILRLYNLPARLERELLDLFDGWPREGVPIEDWRYFPADFRPRIPLYVYLSPQRRGREYTSDVSIDEPLDTPVSLLTPEQIDREVDALYEELASLAVFRDEAGVTPEIESRASAQFRRLRHLQQAQADALEAIFRGRLSTLEGGKPEDYARADKLLEKYGDLASSDSPSAGSDIKKP